MSDSIITFSANLAQEYINSSDLFPVDFDDAWQWLGYSTKQKAKTKLKNNFEIDLDYTLNQTVKCHHASRGGGSSLYNEIKLTIDCFKSLAMMAGTSQGKQVRKYFLECEKIAKNAIAKPKTALQLAKENLRFAEQQIKLLEEIELLEIQNENLEQENHLLSEAVDELFNYSSIVRIAKFNNISETNFNWRKLKILSEKMELEIKKVPCPRFVTKNLYSHDVWRIAYPEFSLPETTTLIIQR